MINFYPGPSKVYPQVKNYVSRGLRSGIIAMNHRSPEFMCLMAETVELLRLKLNVPDTYEVIFTSSATECWEIIAQSLVEKKSCHVYNGAFGAKWLHYTSRLVTATQAVPFTINQWPEMVLDDDCDIICLTQNETSNGTQLPNSKIKEWRDQYPDRLIAVDATSSMAGISLNFKAADLWVASVQKCFGLPAGQAIMICSPRAIREAQRINENNHYNSLGFLLENAFKNQTAYTPNMLGIYLLNQLLIDLPPIDVVARQTSFRFKQLTTILEASKSISSLSNSRETLSLTVFALVSHALAASEIIRLAKQRGIQLGKGYGDWREESFRIANFPAITAGEWDALLHFIRELAT